MQWEYKIVRLDAGSYFSDAAAPTEAELNELGERGWELATSIDSSEIKLGGRGGSTTGLVFKRPVEGDDDADGERSHTGQ